MATFSAPRGRKGLARYARRNGNFVLVFSTHPLTPTLSPPVRGEGEDWEWGANPGFRWRSTLGYSYFAPNGAGTKH